jgi:hypothetical protein
MLDTVKGLKDITDATVRKSTAIELQENILTAREQYDAVVEKAKELEQKLARFETWDEEKHRYELRELRRGAFAWVVKPECAGGEPVHALCPACYERRTKSILQSNGEPQWTKHSWDCPNCNAHVRATQSALSDLSRPSSAVA